LHVLHVYVRKWLEREREGRGRRRGRHQLSVTPISEPLYFTYFFKYGMAHS